MGWISETFAIIAMLKVSHSDRGEFGNITAGPVGPALICSVLWSSSTDDEDHSVVESKVPDIKSCQERLSLCDQPQVRRGAR